MDGFALGEDIPGNAVQAANTPQLDYLFSQYPFCQLEASGLDVGLPEGQMGNSEVGHTNIGAGRVVFQDLPASAGPSRTAASLKTPPIWLPSAPAKKAAVPCISWACCPTAASTATSTICLRS